MMTVTLTEERRPPFSLAITGCAAVAVGFGFARYGFGLFASTFRAEFGLSTATIGAVGSAASLTYLVSLLGCGVLTARLGPRMPVLVANLTAVGGLTVMACATTAPVLIAGVVIAGASSGMVWGPFADAVGGNVAAQWRDPTLSVISSGTTFGLVIAGVLALSTTDSGQAWRVIWLVFAALAAAVTVAAYVAMPAASTIRRRDRFRPTSAAVPVCALSVLYGAAGATFFTFAVDLVRGEGLSPRWSALLWVLVGIGGISGVATGAVVRRCGLTRSLQATVALLAGSIALLAVAPSTAALTTLAALGFGLAYMPLAALLTIWNQRLHPRNATSGLVLALCSLGVGSVVGPAAVGVLADASGLRLAFVLTAGVLLAGGLPVCGRAKGGRASVTRGRCEASHS